MSVRAVGEGGWRERKVRAKGEGGKRVMDFQEIKLYAKECLRDAPPPCVSVCPLGVDVRALVSKVRAGRIDSAYRAYREAVLFPRVVSTFCLAPCREACVRALLSTGGVELTEIERVVVAGASQGGQSRYAAPKKAARVAVKGSGLSGLACAYRLASKGYRVTVYEGAPGAPTADAGDVGAGRNDEVARFAESQAADARDGGAGWNDEAARFAELPTADAGDVGAWWNDEGARFAELPTADAGDGGAGQSSEVARFAESQAIDAGNGGVRRNDDVTQFAEALAADKEELFRYVDCEWRMYEEAPAAKALIGYEGFDAVYDGVGRTLPGLMTGIEGGSKPEPSAKSWVRGGNAPGRDAAEETADGSAPGSVAAEVAADGCASGRDVAVGVADEIALGLAAAALLEERLRVGELSGAKQTNDNDPHNGIIVGRNEVREKLYGGTAGPGAHSPKTDERFYKLKYDFESVAGGSEAEKCLMCNCSACIDACPMIRWFRQNPKRIAADLGVSLLPVKGKIKRVASRMLNSCNLCGLCTTVCPVGVDTRAAMYAGRRLLNEGGNLAPAFHDFWLDDLAFSMSEEAYGVVFCPEQEPGPETSLLKPPAVLFFPGCQLSASLPDTVARTFGFISSYEPGAAMLLACCGIPADWAAEQAIFKKTVAKLRADWEALDEPEVLFACSACKKTFEKALPEVRGRLVYEWLASVYRVGGSQANCLLGTGELSQYAVAGPLASTKEASPCVPEEPSPCVALGHLTNTEEPSPCVAKEPSPCVASTKEASPCVPEEPSPCVAKEPSPCVAAGHPANTKELSPCVANTKEPPPCVANAAAVYDPCNSRDDAAGQAAVRKLAEDLGFQLDELTFSGEEAACCGFGGHIYPANPGLLKAILEERAADEPGLPRITYCANCRDLFLYKGIKSAHILELLFPAKAPDDRPPEVFREVRPPSLSERRENRRRLKALYPAETCSHGAKSDSACRSIPYENPSGVDASGSGAKSDSLCRDSSLENSSFLLYLEIPPAVEAKMDRLLVLRDEVARVIAVCEGEGAKAVDPVSSHFVGHFQVRSATIWVEYSIGVEGHATVHNVYTHRMSLETRRSQQLLPEEPEVHNAHHMSLEKSGIPHQPKGAALDAFQETVTGALPLLCANCKAPLTPIETKFSYLGHDFSHPVPGCSECGLVCIPEGLATGKIAEVESMLEDK